MKTSTLKYLITIIFFILHPYCFAVDNKFQIAYEWCKADKKLYLARSQELSTLAKMDQLDRKHWQNMSETEMIKTIKNDRNRRKRVGEIFGEGCLIKAKDYMNAALIYQHGLIPDHYYQAFIWSQRGAELGAPNGQSLSALAIDRYLISIGKKQLFGTQYLKTSSDKCFCMQPVEQSFSDTFRKKYSTRSLEDNYNIMSSLNDKTCPKIECKTSLQPTPKESVYKKILEVRHPSPTS